MKKLGKQQQGFTIIELVVVILLLGILTATALPRFGGLTESAHQGVVNGVYSALVTSDNLFEAQWYAAGQPVGTVVSAAGYPSLIANSDGNAVGTVAADFSADPNTGSEVACKAIYDAFVSSGPGALTAEAVAFDTDAETTVEGAAAASDIVVTTDAAGAAAAACVFYYTGQFDSGESAPNDVTIPKITYTIATGAWAQGTQALSTDAP